MKGIDIEAMMMKRIDIDEITPELYNDALCSGKAPIKGKISSFLFQTDNYRQFSMTLIVSKQDAA